MPAALHAPMFRTLFYRPLACFSESGLHGVCGEATAFSTLPATPVESVFAYRSASTSLACCVPHRESSRIQWGARRRCGCERECDGVKRLDD
ncbi:hypothetical protein BaRGS_00007441 [Batillaria attramentaria]|uniref:Secreted protein n=1 Tax=Batillaria attramentaria TaxID=370345 RepID=A0ABD0LQ77_9CAEN